jgi:hypothetical protein
VNKALKNRFKLGNQSDSIFLTKGSASITFDRIIKCLNGTVSGTKMASLDSPTAYGAKKKLDSSKNNCLKKTAQVHDLKLKLDFKV